MAFDFTPKHAKHGFNFTKAEDPLKNVQYTDSLAADTKSETDALQTAYRARAAKEKKRFADATDSEYWVAICFKNRAAKESFLKQTKTIMLGDKYVDGHQFAHMLGLELDEGN